MSIEIRAEESTLSGYDYEQKIVEMWIDVSPTERIYFLDFVVTHRHVDKPAELAAAIANRKAELLCALKKIAPLLMEDTPMANPSPADFRTLMQAFDGSLSKGLALSEALVGGHDLGNHRSTARLLIIKAMRAAYLRGLEVGKDVA